MISAILRVLTALAGTFVGLIFGAHIVAHFSEQGLGFNPILMEPLYVVQRLDAMLLPLALKANHMLEFIPGYSWVLNLITFGNSGIIQLYPTVYLLCFVCIVDTIWSLTQINIHFKMNVHVSSRDSTPVSKTPRRSVRQPGEPLPPASSEKQDKTPTRK